MSVQSDFANAGKRDQGLSFCILYARKLIIIMFGGESSCKLSEKWSAI